jgi:hypothetical protein
MRFLALTASICLLWGASGCGHGVDPPAGRDIGWDAHRLLQDDQTVRLSVLGSGSYEFLGVLVHEVGGSVVLTVRVKDQDSYTADLTASCVETTLPEPVSGRRLLSGEAALSDSMPGVAKKLDGSLGGDGQGCAKVESFTE